MLPRVLFLGLPVMERNPVTEKERDSIQDMGRAPLDRPGISESCYPVCSLGSRPSPTLMECSAVTDRHDAWPSAPRQSVFARRMEWAPVPSAFVLAIRAASGLNAPTSSSAVRSEKPGGAWLACRPEPDSETASRWLFAGSRESSLSTAPGVRT